MLLTDPYLTDQLIPYIGNKRKLLPLICSAVEATGIRNGTFCDFFAGSGVISRLAKGMGFRVISNDWEHYSEFINLAYIQSNSPPPFARLGGLASAIDTLNNLAPTEGYISMHYCPEDDENPDLEHERMFYTQENGRRIDAMREQISLWKTDGIVDRTEEAVLIAPLIYQASYCSNTSGVFKAFHRGWGGATSTALYRIRSRLTLSQPIFYDNGMDNLAVREDANKLAEQVECDIAYLDPPYNQHQYGSNYHLLNTVALWDKPKVSRRVNPGPGPRDKSAIRLDWRTLSKSSYCYATTALPAFSELVARIRARCVLVSYSTDGIVPARDLLEALSSRGRLTVITRRYKRYRVSSQRPSAQSHTVEFIAIVDTTARPNPSDAIRALEEIRAVQEAEMESAL